MKTTTQTLTNINISNNFNVGFSSLKKGFTSIATSIDSALKSSPDDMSDTISIRSDISSDSEHFVVVPTGGEGNVESTDLMFYVAEFCDDSKSVEIASDVLEEENSLTSNSDHSLASSCRRKDLVSFFLKSVSKNFTTKKRDEYKKNV